MDDLPSAERDVLRASLVSVLEPAALLDAIAAATEAFLAELQRNDADLAERLSAPLRTVVAASRDELRA